MLSRYTNFEHIGSGGMGVVYRADDATLQRPVALKFLTKGSLTEDQRRARFLREARTAAALNHPNVCTIHEVGEVQPGEEGALGDDQHLEPGMSFIAMELIEGQTLSTLLQKSGRLPLEEMLRIAVRIAEGLVAAHAKGIVHRDLKPGNVMITPDGQVKILDFGLAKPLRPALADDQMETAAQTVSAELTQIGRVLGTVAYMSPEQAQGKQVDSRSDVFSFGILLYEMAVGKRPFHGESSASTMAKILESEPQPLTDSRPDLPGELQRIVRRCLKKIPDERYNDTRDLVAALKELREDTTSGTPLAAASPAAQKPPRHRVVLMAAGVTLLVCVLALAAWVLFGGRGPANQTFRSTQLTSNPPENLLLCAAISPDGKYLAFGDLSGLHLRLLDTGETRQLLDERSIDHVAWSNDGTWLYLVQWRPDEASLVSLWKLSIMGGGLTKLRDGVSRLAVDPASGRLAVATESGRTNANVIEILDPEGGVLAELATLGNEIIHALAWSPDGKWIACLSANSRMSVDRKSRIDLFQASTGNRQTLIEDQRRTPSAGGFTLAWSPDWRLFFKLYPDSDLSQGQQADLCYVTVDQVTGRARSEPQQLIDWSDVEFGDLSITAAGDRMTFSRARTQADVYVARLDLDGGAHVEPARRLTLDERDDEAVDWMPDSRTVVFKSNRTGKWTSYGQKIDVGSSATMIASELMITAITPSGTQALAWRLSQDGCQLVNIDLGDAGVQPICSRPAGAWDTHRIQCITGQNEACFMSYIEDDSMVVRALEPLAGPGEVLMRVPTGEEWILDWSISPDGSHLAIADNRPFIRIYELGTAEPHVLHFSIGLITQRVSWLPDGKTLIVGGQLTEERERFRIFLIRSDGYEQELWKSPCQWVSGITPSPDGQHLAFTVFNCEANVWMLEDF